MPHHTHTSIFTTVSGEVGGVGKAISAKPLLMSVTLPGLSTVALYAAAGYVVKKALDSISEKLNKFFKENFKDNNE